MITNNLFFSRIDNELKAYWLGFIYGDGCIYQILNRHGKEIKTGSINITLSKKDEHHLKKFADIFSSNMYHDEKRNGCRVSICNMNLFYDLKNLGMPERNLDIILQRVPGNLLRHFVRGLFDADGSVYLKRRPDDMSFGIGIDIVFAEKKLAIGVQDILCKYTKLSKVKIYDYKKQRCFRLSYGGSTVPLFFARWIYDDSHIFLERKYNIFRDYYIDLMRIPISKINEYNGVDDYNQYNKFSEEELFA